MASEDTPAEAFKVRDRRGQDADAEQSRSPRAESAPEPDRPPRSPEPTEAAQAGSFELPLGPDLASLFLLLANSALLHLGEAPEAMAGRAPADLAQARFSIDLLRLLKEKTEGNRTPEETRLLEGVLYDLQLRFVQAAGRG